MLYQNLLDELTAVAKETIGAALTGVYLHGSLAMGCFHPEKSDIDLILVIEDNISDTQKLEFMNQIVVLNRRAPKKGLELSIIKREYCAPFRYPTPFALHFSPAHLSWFLAQPQHYIQHMSGADKDLAAHFTVLRQYGAVLYGAPIQDVFAEVPRAAYLDSIWEDVRHAETDILEDPVYMILNLCRVLAFLEEGLCLSKKAGGQWALSALPARHRPLISTALACYGSGQDMAPPEPEARAFAAELLTAIEENMDKG